MTALPARSPRSPEPELVALRKLAGELAKSPDKATTGHLLAAIAQSPGLAQELLGDRRLGAAVLLSAARVVTDDSVDAVSRAVQRARELASRSPGREPTAVHLLYALCQDPGTAAHRALVQCGADVGKLRMAAMQVALGLTPPRRQTPVRAPILPSPPIATQREPEKSKATAASQLCLPVPKPKHTRREPRAPGKADPHRRSASPSSSPSISSGPSIPSSPSPSPPAVAPRDPSKLALDPKKFPLLCQIGKNLTLAAAKGELEPTVARDEEVERTLDVLAKRRANTPCLVGAPGVGKTSVARGVAAHFAMEGEGRLLIEIEASALLAGTGMRGALAERLAALKAETAKAEGKVVLFFDEVHALLEDGGEEAASELGNALAAGEIACVSATGEADYKRVVLSHPALARRFTPIEVLEISSEDAFLALERVAPAFARHHGVRFSSEALAASIGWSARYLPGRALPDKAIGILDLAGARAKRRSLREVGPPEIASVVSEMAGVPVERLLESDGERMLRLEELLARRIVGHETALARIAAVLRRNASGFRTRRPIGSFLLLGPTGVGKTETAKAIAECLFHSPRAMTRLDLSEYAEPHSIARLVGAPPGYVGHEAGGQLTHAVQRRPYQVILLDEIEKAHGNVLEAFLQVFDEGHMTDGRGHTVDFTSTVILLTSNLGADAHKEALRGIGFGRTDGASRAAEDRVLAAAKGALPPELWNRFDEVIVFAPLSRADVREVARRMLRTLGEELEKAKGVRLDVSDEAVEALLEQGGFDPEMGARPMRRAIGKKIEAKLAEMILKGELSRGDVATVEVDGGDIVLDVVRPDTKT